MFDRKQLLVLAVAGMLVFGGAAGVQAAPDNFSVTADELNYNFQSGDGNAKGNVVLKQNGGTATANYAEFNSKSKSGTLIGNVVADRDGMHINCDKFVAHDLDHFSAMGGAVLSKDGRTLTADQVDYSKPDSFAETVGSWAKLTDNEGSVLDCAKLDYNQKTGVANAYGGVSIDSPSRNLVASADKAVYRTGEGGGIDLYGHAKATQNGNSVSGEKLHLSNTNKAVADGNVHIYYVPDEPAVVNKETAVDTTKA